MCMVKQNGSKRRLRGPALIRAIQDMQKDPAFVKEIKQFIKATTR